MRRTRGGLAAACAVLSLTALPAFAAGGHHAVDDANILPRGRCEQEDWFSREQGGARLLHVAFNCGTGPLELGAAGEHTRDGDSAGTAWNLEAKWARTVAEGWNIGLDVQPVWQAGQRPRYQLTRFVGLATWAPPSRPWALHLNLGHDFVRGGRDFGRYGVSADCAPIEHWTFTAEAFSDTGTRFARVGARWAISERVTVDFSRAQHLSGPAPSNFTVGVTFGFE